MIDPVNFERDGITELQALVGEYTFQLTRLAVYKPIRIRVWLRNQGVGGDRYLYTISHAVQTPEQASPYLPSNPFADSEQRAVEKAIRDFLFFLPKDTDIQESWIKPNSNF